MTLQAIPDALLTVSERVYHYFSPEADKAGCIVWAEDGQAGSLWADGRMQQQALTGTIDYFTKREDDKRVDVIQEALNAAGIPWRLNSIQFEDDTGLIHYEWVWEFG